MQITLLGASGKIGRQLTTVLLERGHTVVALVHSNNNPISSSDKLCVITGDVHNTQDIVTALKGSEVVVSCLGSWGTKSKDIVSTATRNLIPVMEEMRIKRFISVTGGGAWTPNEKLSLLQKGNHTLLGIIGKPILRDAEEHLRLLSGSTLDWTAIRSPIMTDKDTARYHLSTTPPAPWATISRHAVVLALLHLIENNDMLKSAPYITVK